MNIRFLPILLLTAGMLTSPLTASVPLWELTPDDRAYLDGSAGQRTVAYNPVTGNLYLFSAVGTGAPGRIYILDSQTGEDIGELSMTGVDSGEYPLSEVAVAEDGTIYAMSITLTPATNPYRIYRWLNETAEPQLIYSGDPTGGMAAEGWNARWGKNVALRGTKDAIEILVKSASNLGALFTGSDWLSVTLFSDLPTYKMERGLAWGDGDTFYVNSSEGWRALHYFSFDRVAGTTQLIRFYDSTVFPHRIGPIMVDLERRILGGIEVGGAGVSQYAVFYDLDSLSSVFPNTAFLSVPFTSRTNNAAGYGGMAYGNGRAFAMNTRNGILAAALSDFEPTFGMTEFGRGGNGDLELSIRSSLPVEGVTHLLEGSPSLEAGSWNALDADWVQPLRGGRASLRLALPDDARHFYRLKANRLTPPVAMHADHTTGLSRVEVNGVVIARSGTSTYVAELGGAETAMVTALTTDPGAQVFINGVPLGAGSYSYSAASGLPVILQVEVLARNGRNTEAFTLELR
jgi:hypothetical protein